MAARLAAAILAGSILATGVQAKAGPPRPACMMTVLSPTHAVETPQAVMAKGTVWGPATQMRIARLDGHVAYCAHGDYCYPADHLRFLTPCTPAATPIPATAGDTGRLYALRGKPSR